MLHSNYRKREFVYLSAIIFIMQHETGKDIDNIIKEYDIDLTTRSKNSEGILLLNALYYLFNERIIHEDANDIIIPRKLSPNYVKILLKYDKITIHYKILKGISPAIVGQIRLNKYLINEEECGVTEKGNTIIHIQGAFNRKEDVICMKEFYIDEYINNIGWTPLFMSIFHNNSSARQYFELHTLNKNHVDYFGNDAFFYENKTHK